MGDLRDLTLDKLTSLSHEVYIEKYSHFDVLTGVRILVILLRTSEALSKDSDQISWKRALDTIEECIRLCPHSEREAPQYHRWKEVIGKAYADFQANLPGYEPSLLSSLAMTVDGRTEGSNYPNLILPAERERYGL